MKQIKNIIKTFSIAVLVVMSTASKAQTRSAIAENKVAILPITYISEGSEARMDEMRYRLQNIAYQYLRQDAMELKFQDPAETNALLLKNGVRESNFREFTPRELAEILKVEYVLVGSVSQEVVGMSTMSNTTRGYYTNGRRRVERETRGHTRTVEDLSTNIDLDVYNDSGEKIYSKSRRSILSTVDAYKAGLQYLLKRSPLHRK
jgi:hypothetical protein